MLETVDREEERESVSNVSHCSSDVMAQTPPTPPARLSFSSLLSPFLTTSPLHLLSSLCLSFHFQLAQLPDCPLLSFVVKALIHIN